MMNLNVSLNYENLSFFRLYGLQSQKVFTSLSDSNLDDLVRRLSQGNDNVGANAVKAMLFGQGVKVIFNACCLLHARNLRCT